MPTAPVPLTFPSGLQRGARNGQNATGAVGERLERAAYHLLGARRLQFPGSSFPRTYTGTGTLTTLYTKVLRAAHTYGARLYLQYATFVPQQNFKITLAGAVTNPSIALPGTSNGYSVDDAAEASMYFVLGSNVDSERAIVDLSLTLAFTWADPVIASLLTPGIRIYSWQIIPDDVQTVTGS